MIQNPLYNPPHPQLFDSTYKNLTNKCKKTKTKCATVNIKSTSFEQIEWTNI